MKLVIASKNPDIEIGSSYRGLKEGPWKYGALPDQCYRVVSRSTADGWIDSNVALGAPRDHLEVLVQINLPWYYYEIQTD